MIDVPQILETPRLRLVMPQAGMGALVHDALLDGYQSYVNWLHWDPKEPSVDEVERDCRKRHAQFILRDMVSFIIFEKESNSVLGRSGFAPPQTFWEIPQFGIAYFIRESKRGRGFAGEAAHAMAKLAFDVLLAKKIEIHCDKLNVPSNRVPQKLGFDLERSQKGGWLSSDKKNLADLNIYSLFDESSLPSLSVSFG